MPATERAFTELLPPHLYIDTDFTAASLVSAEPQHSRCAAFVDRLLEHGSVTLYLSTLLRLEYANYLVKQSVRDKLPPDLQAQFRLNRWGEPDIREHYLQTMLAQLYEFLEHFDWQEAEFTEAIAIQAWSNMARYAMKPMDAAHLATATAFGVLDIASFDEKYRKVDGIYLWNDHIHLPTTR